MQKNYLFLKFLLMFVFACPFAHAKCDDTEGTRDSIAKNCLHPPLAKATASMDSEVKMLRKLLEEDSMVNETTASTLVDQSQKQWLTYRDSFCEAKGLATLGGISSRSIPELECKLDLVKGRRAELQRLISFLKKRNAIGGPQ
jgi:uncharacterized protein YecT (DUF1311 family)